MYLDPDALSEIQDLSLLYIIHLKETHINHLFRSC